MKAEDGISIEDLKAIKDAMGEPQIGFPLRVIENEFLADDMIVVSSKMFKALKERQPPKDHTER